MLDDGRVTRADDGGHDTCLFQQFDAVAVQNVETLEQFSIQAIMHFSVS